ncbi:hypothetical protein CHS0354_039398 [Potamilus streckersoni]|uniref:Uncharacterized protein n=1 Tax=Potamilus streckersoni TaxID=2493646 RepID=A0AAE0S1N7_9BIVA|nr:hypothetical protein CHS0354_039398 [Potamilus streckersoni]
MVEDTPNECNTVQSSNGDEQCEEKKELEGNDPITIVNRYDRLRDPLCSSAPPTFILGDEHKEEKKEHKPLTPFNSCGM